MGRRIVTIAKDARRIVAYALRNRYKLINAGRNHPRLLSPDGKWIVMSSSASDTNAGKNIARDIRRDFERRGEKCPL